jgi:hypothetical protein
MDFRGREEKFREADRRYAELKRQLDAGSISDEEFEAERQRLMVLNEGHWWAKSRETGDWHYHDGSAWVRGTPPGYQPPPTDEASERQSQLKQGEGMPSSQTTPTDSLSTHDRNGREQRRGVLRWSTLAAGLVGVGIVIWLLVPYVAPHVQGEIEGPSSEEVPAPEEDPAPEEGPSSEEDPAPEEGPSSEEASSVIFRDDFSTGGWPYEPFPGGADEGYWMGGYWMTVPPGTPILSESAPVDQSRVKDASVEVDASNTGNTGNAPDSSHQGVVCRRLDPDNFYALGVNPNTGPIIVKIEDGQASILVEDGPSNTIKKGTATNRIRGDCAGSKLTLYVNGQKLLETSDTGLSSGQVGLYAHSGGEPPGNDVLFDNFLVSKP